jgi:hypothetical protein
METPRDLFTDIWTTWEAWWKIGAVSLTTEMYKVKFVLEDRGGLPMNVAVLWNLSQSRAQFVTNLYMCFIS